MSKTCLWMLPVILIFSCKKPALDPVATENVTLNVLSPDRDSLLASIHDTLLKPKDISFYDGQTVEQFLQGHDTGTLNHWGKKVTGGPNDPDPNDPYKQFVSILLSAGTLLCDTTQMVFTDPGGPQQAGLAYVYGSSDYTIRQVNGKCTDHLHGLDGSGLLATLFHAAGLHPRIDPINWASPGFFSSNLLLLNEVLESSAPFKSVYYENKGNIPFNQIDAGDILYFNSRDTLTDKEGNIIDTYIATINIGVIASGAVNSSGTAPLYVYQVNGTTVKSTYDGTGTKLVTAGCEFNSPAVGRGVRCIPVSEFINKPGFTDYGVLKIYKPADGTNTAPLTAKAVNIAVKDGDGQFADIDKQLPNAISVQVYNELGRPIQGAVVSFTPAWPGDKLSNPTVTTNQYGIAQTYWTQEDQPGTHKLNITTRDASNQTISNSVTATTDQFILSNAVLYRDSFPVPCPTCANGIGKLYILNMRCNMTTAAANWNSSFQEPYATLNGVLCKDPITVDSVKFPNGQSTSFINPPGGWIDGANSGPLASYSNISFQNGLVSCQAIFEITFGMKGDELPSMPVLDGRGDYTVQFNLTNYTDHITATFGWSNKVTAHGDLYPLNP